jgi:AcrR family transcriptional regulator
MTLCQVTDRTRARILDATGQALDAEAEPTYGAIAKRAGVSRQTLYAHFPTRGSLLVAFADRERARADADHYASAVFGAPTALAALDGLIAFHVAFTPLVMNAVRLVEHERANDPTVESEFEARVVGRRQIVGHVMTRLHAENLLDPFWTVDAATDLVDRLISATATHELLAVRGWTTDELRSRLTHTLHKTLTTAIREEQP